MFEANEEELQKEPSSAVIESRYFFATVTLESEEEHPEAKIASAMRMQNNLSHGVASGCISIAPTYWEHNGHMVTFSVVGMCRGCKLREEWHPTGRRYPEEDGYTVNKVADHLQRVFGGHAEVRPLQEGLDHPEDLELMDSFRALANGTYTVADHYPSVDDLVCAGKQANSVLGSQGAYAANSPYFKCTLVTKTSDVVFDPEAWSYACGSLFRSANIAVFPSEVVCLADGRYEIELICENLKPSLGGPAPAPATDACANPIAYYFDCDVKSLTTLKTTVNHKADVIEAGVIADELDLVGRPEPEDFAVVSEEERALAQERTTRTWGAADEEKKGIDELNELIGLERVKKQIIEFVNYASVQKKRGGQMPSLHFYMTGNPGTGKTTVARIVAHMLYDEGVLPKRNVFVEGDRATLVGGAVGQTALKTQAAIREARRGMLFIDEAYALDGGSEHDYGKEAIATLLKAMEDCLVDYDRVGFVCAMGGYPKEMEKMISLNPGLRNRFGFHLEFPDYSPEELMQVYDLYCSREGYETAPEARELLLRELEWIVGHKDEDFANARVVRKIFERAKMRQASLFGESSVFEKETFESVLADKDIKEMLNGKASGSFGFAA